MGRIESEAELLVLLFVAALVITGSAGWMVWLKRRVKVYVESFTGGILLSSTWEPFPAGWFWEKYTVYLVNYKDSFGNIHKAIAKVTPFGNVSLTDDSVVIQRRPQ